MVVSWLFVLDKFIITQSLLFVSWLIVLDNFIITRFSLFWPHFLPFLIQTSKLRVKMDLRTALLSYDSAENEQKLQSFIKEIIRIVGPCSAPVCASLGIAFWDKCIGEACDQYFSQSSPLRRQFSAVTTVSERLSLFLANDVSSFPAIAFRMSKDLYLLCTCNQKNAHKADEMRLAANQTYKEKNYMGAYIFYTMGLMRAPEFSDEAALLYGNRSAAYYHAEQFENALEDIEQAFKMGYARLKPTKKLFIRKTECLLKLGQIEEAKKMFESKEILSLNEARLNELKDLAKNTHVEKRNVNLFKFQEASVVINVLAAKGKFTSHKKYPWLNSKVDLRYDAENGYQLFAKEDLAYGEIAAIGEPFVSWAMFKFGSHRPHQCDYCMIDMKQSDDNSVESNPELIDSFRKLQGFSSGPSRCFAPVPCVACPNVIFCSEGCRNQAWDSFHRFECSQVLFLNSLNHQARLALRMLYSAGSLERIKQVAHDEEHSSDRFEMMKNPRDYAFVYSMRQKEEMDPEEAFRLIATAVFLTKLAQFSGFVGNDREDELFTVRTLLRHLIQLKANVAMPTNVNPREPTRKPTRLHGIATLMNSSSRQANIARFWVAQRSIIQSNAHIFYVTKPIKAGTKLRIVAGYQRKEIAEEDLQFDFFLTSSAY